MNKKYVVITRSVEKNKSFQKKLEKNGFRVFAYPCIETIVNELDESAKNTLYSLKKFDWILFTSSNSVIYFMQALNILRIDQSILKTKKIGVVGPSTAVEAEKNQMRVDYIPPQFTSKSFAQTILGIANKKMLIPRTNIANPIFLTQLKERGAKATDISIYKTTYAAGDKKKFTELLQNEKINSILFTSPSAVTACAASLSDEIVKKKLLAISVISIGPVTTKAAIQKKFQDIFTADIHTTEGMLVKLVEFNQPKSNIG